MDFVAIQAALTSWFATLSGLDCEWFEEPNFIYNEPFALLNIGPVSNDGVDGTLYEFDEGTDTLSAAQFGVRRFTVHCRVRAFDQRAGFSARQALERARLRMGRDSSTVELNAAGLALISAEPLVLQDYDFDGRRISQIMMDMIFATHAQETDDTYDGSYIGQATGEGTLDPQEHSVPFDADSL